MRIERDRAMNTIKISQPGHIENLLKTHAMSEAKSQASPIEPNTNNTIVITPEDFQANPEDVTAFKLDLESLIYLIIRTRPDIAFSIDKLAIYSNNPTNIYWQALKRVFRYLASTRTRDIQYKGANNIELSDYTNTD